MQVFRGALLFGLMVHLHFQFCCAMRISDLKCMEYATLYENKKLNRQIDLFGDFFNNLFKVPAPGKLPTIPGEFPHMAHLGYIDPKTKKKHFVCGGVLISDLYILTTASCTNANVLSLHNRKKRQTEEEVEEETTETTETAGIADGILGAFPRDIPINWIQLGDSKSGFLNYQAEKIILHPDNSPPLLYNDIALIKLTKRVNFTEFIKPACLYTKDEDLTNRTVVATGWGVTAFDSDLSKGLMKVPLEILTEDECNVKFFYSIFENGLDENQICAGDRNGTNTLCQGDGGAPLQLKNEIFPNMYDVAGLVSAGYMCNVMTLPLYATKITSYISWIEDVVWRDNA